MAFNQAQTVDAGHSHFNDVQGNQIVYITNTFITERGGRRLGPEANRPLLGFGSNTDRPNDPPTPQRLLFNAVRSGILPRGNAAVTISDANDGDDEATSHGSPREGDRIFNEAEGLGYRVLSFNNHIRHPVASSATSESHSQSATRPSPKPSRISPNAKQIQTPATRQSREPTRSTNKLESSNATSVPRERHSRQKDISSTTVETTHLSTSNQRRSKESTSSSKRSQGSHHGTAQSSRGGRGEASRDNERQASRPHKVDTTLIGSPETSSLQQKHSTGAQRRSVSRLADLPDASTPSSTTRKERCPPLSGQSRISATFRASEETLAAQLDSPLRTHSASSPPPTPRWIRSSPNTAPSIDVRSSTSSAPHENLFRPFSDASDKTLAEPTVPSFEQISKDKMRSEISIGVAHAPTELHSMWTMALDRVVRCLCFSPDGRLLLSGSRDGKLTIWDVRTGESLLGPMKLHSQSIHSVAFSPNGMRIITGSRDKTVGVWDATMGHAILKPLLKHTQCVTSVAHSASHIISASKDGSVCFWDAYSGGLLAQYRVGVGASVTSVAFSADGTWALTGSDGLNLWVYRPTGWQHQAYPPDFFLGSKHAFKHVGISADGSRILCVTVAGARVFATHSGTPLTPTFDQNEYITSAAFSPNGTLVMSGSREGVLRLGDVAQEGDMICGSKLSIGGAGGRNYLRRDVYCVSFSPDGHHVACGDAITGIRVYSLR